MSTAQAQGTKWLGWSELPWIAKPEFGPVVQLCDRMLQAATEASTASAFLSSQLPELATEFSAQWVGLLERGPQWRARAEFGRHPLRDLPFSFFEEALDRERGGIKTLGEPAGWSVVALPLSDRGYAGRVLALLGRSLNAQTLPSAVAVARVFAISVAVAGERDRHAAAASRLKTMLNLAASFAAVHESQPLLELIAQEATRLLKCDRASIFVWDRDARQVVACPALGVEGNTLRLPDNVGIVGDVIHGGRTVRVDDAYSDPRFNKSVDKSSGYKTRNLLCTPLRDADGKLIGAFEGINKLDGTFNAEDEETLSLLGTQAAGALENAREREQLLRNIEQLTERVTQGVRIIGESPAIVALRTTVERLAATDLPVLILGESGTGKEVVAQSLHYQGPRAGHPFIAVNCAALTETLLESELFGHEKGAFTDAREMRPGKFELADGGTLFLDEIGDMSLGGQAKLLRVLEQKVVTRVGGSQTIPVNVRVIAATNANLTELVREKKFREDLYYRLRVVPLELPPLRERPEDILPLAQYFLKQFCAQSRRPSLQLSAEARRRLQSHSWPGNVRELRNLMERVAFLSAGDKVEADDLAFVLSPEKDTMLEPSPDLGLAEATKLFQQDFIRRSIKRVQGNMSEAARLLGLHRSNLYRKMRQLDMDEASGLE